MDYPNHHPQQPSPRLSLFGNSSSHNSHDASRPDPSSHAHPYMRYTSRPAPAYDHPPRRVVENDAPTATSAYGYYPSSYYMYEKGVAQPYGVRAERNGYQTGVDSLAGRHGRCDLSCCFLCPSCVLSASCLYLYTAYVILPSDRHSGTLVPIGLVPAELPESRVQPQ